jgi:predicted PurR-regulated permease PerM
MGWRSSDVIRAAALVIAMYLFIRLLWFAYPLFFAAFLGVLFGLAITKAVDKLERWHIRRGIGAALIVFGVLASLVGIVVWAAPTLREQSRELQVKLPEAIDKLDAWMASNRGGLLGSLMSGTRATSEAANALSPDSAAGRGGTAPPVGREEPQAGPPQRPETPVQPGAPPQLERPTDARQTAPQGAGAAQGDSSSRGTAGASGGLRERIASGMSGATSYMFGFLTSTVTAIAGLLLVIFLAIYVATDPDTYHRGLMHLFPHSSRNRAGEVLSAMANVLRRWLRTQLIAMAVIGAVTTAALLLLDIPAAIPLGILAGLFEFIPTIGPIMSAVPAVIMGFIDSPEKALTVAIVYSAIQFIENNLLIPYLMKEGMDIPPALTIFAQALMALIFGFLGLLVAVPMLASVMVAVKMLYVEGVVGDDVEIGNEDAEDEDD